MFKFLRKYNKVLLAFFGVLLMITFLIPQAFNQFSQRAAAQTDTVATVGDGQRISAAEWGTYQQDVQIIGKLRQFLPPLPGVGFVQEPEQWFLLVREATQAGLVPVLDPHSASAEEMTSLMNITQTRDPAAITRARAHLAGVAQLLSLYESSDLYSDRRLKADAERLLQTITAQMVVIQPDPAKSSFQPTEAEIESHMKAFADKLPGEGDMGFGYKLPHRVKLEWISIPSDASRRAVETSEDMDAVQLRLHWKRSTNKSLPPYPADGTAPPIPDVVRTDLLDQLTNAKLDEIAKFATDTLRLSQRGLVEEEGYFVLPADWRTKQLPFPNLAEQVRDRFQIDLPEYTARGDQWLTLDELASLPGIGMATTDKFGASPTAMTALVQAAREFGGHTTIIMQSGIASPPLRDADGNLYVFRITDTDASRVPSSVDEVRERVVNDLKRKAEFERLNSTLADIEAQARDSGLLETALAFNTVVQPATPVYLWSEFWVNAMVQYNMPMNPQPSTLPVIGPNRSTIEAILDRVEPLVSDKPVADLPAAQRTFVIPVPDSLALLAFEVESIQPLSSESFDRMVQMGAIQRLVAAEDADPDQSLAKVFSLEELAKRNKFAFERPAKSEDPAATQPMKAASAG